MQWLAALLAAVAPPLGAALAAPLEPAPVEAAAALVRALAPSRAGAARVEAEQANFTLEFHPNVTNLGSGGPFPSRWFLSLSNTTADLAAGVDEGLLSLYPPFSFVWRITI